MDDMVVKFESVGDHADDIREILGQIRRYNMCLNPAKCLFRIGGGKFLGFILMTKAIKVKLDKCKSS